MSKTDPTLAQITAQFTQFDVRKNRGGYVILDRRGASPIARLRPIPGTDRFELFYWSNTTGRGRPSETSAASNSCSRALMRLSKTIQCFASREADEHDYFWPKSS